MKRWASRANRSLNYIWTSSTVLGLISASMRQPGQMPKRSKYLQLIKENRPKKFLRAIFYEKAFFARAVRVEVSVLLFVLRADVFFIVFLIGVGFALFVGAFLTR